MRMNWKPLRTGLTVGVILWAILGLLWVKLGHGAEGLPDDAPDLYDPAVIASYQQITKAPSRIGGCTCENTVLASNNAYSQDQSGRRTPLIFILGFLRDLSTQRIVVIVETFIHYAPPHRSIRAWSDAAWLSGKAATGEWTAYHGTDLSPPMTKREAKEYLKPLYEAIRDRRDTRQ